MNKKKIIVGISALACTVISICLWIWYATIPSFDSTNKTFEQLDNESFDNGGMK